MVQHNSAGSTTAAQARWQNATAVLVVRNPPSDRGRSATVARAGVSVGRGATSDLILTDQSVSRRHAIVRWRDGECVLEDLGSLNGTYLNGERVTTSRALRDGDEVRFGRTVAEFRLAGAGRSVAGAADVGHDPDWNPGAPTRPIDRRGRSTTQHAGHNLRDGLRAAHSFSPAALLLAVLGSVVGTVLLSALEGDAFHGQWWRLVGAAAGPVISTTFTTRQAGEKGVVRGAIIVLLSSGALLITVSGTSLSEFASRAPVLSQSDEGTSTFPVPGLSDRMSGPGTDDPDPHSGETVGMDDQGGSAGIDVAPGVLECEPALSGEDVTCGVVLIRNNGDTPLVVLAVDVAGSHPQDFVVHEQCGQSQLDVGQFCEVHITFAPIESGEREAVLVVEHDAPGGNAEVTLLGSAGSDLETAEG
jgi:hypothetical protein